MVVPLLRCVVHFLSILFSFASLSSSLTAPSPLQERTGIYPRQDPLASTACGDIFSSTKYVFPATLAYECLTSVPFNKTVATQFLQYYKDTLQFQSTLAYLKNPPPSYQQPEVDLLAGINLIQRQIDTGVFHNEYSFEAALQNLIYQTHDSHIYLNAGALNVFTFGSAIPIVSLSADGFALPKVYSTDDVRTAQKAIAHGVNLGWQPSPIATIDGQEVTDWLTQFAVLNAPGTLEPHADWNQLMSSGAADIQGNWNPFSGSSPFYPGDWMEFTFENGSRTIPVPWLATYSIPYDTPPIYNGKDFYDFFVLVDLYPNLDNGSSVAATTNLPSAATPTASYDTSTTEPFSTALPAAATTTPSSPPSGVPTSSAVPEPTPGGWLGSSYPESPDVVQPDLGLVGGGVLTGYFLNESSIAVLSIPSFELNREAVSSFSATVGEFLRRSQTAGLKKVVIDVQQNGGGDTLLATDTFKQFFPSIDPFGGSRLRASKTADTLGNTFTTYYNTQQMNGSFYDAMSADVWVASTYLNAQTGMNFSSWAEYFGPLPDNGDLFTTTQRDNLSSIIFDVEALGMVVYGFADHPATAPQPYAPEDIIILTDSYCASACAVFVEMMHHEAGVRTVVAGGRPQIGPMQAVAGSRSSQAYATSGIDSDIQVAIELNSSIAEFLPNRDVQLWITYAQFNLRDMIRKGEYFPLQFAYEAADCRIFYTSETFYNYTNLWKYAANAMWYNPALCVQDSTNHPSTKQTDTKGPTPEQKAAWKATAPQTSHLNASSTHYQQVELTGLVDGFTPRTGDDTLNAPCPRTGCPSPQRCIEVNFCSDGKWVKQPQCKQTCTRTAECGNSQRKFVCNPREFVCTTASCKPQGFCESINDRKDSRCYQLEPKPEPTLAAGFGTIVLNPGPMPPPRPSGKGKAKSGDAGARGRTKEEWLKEGTVGSLIYAGMAPVA